MQFHHTIRGLAVADPNRCVCVLVLTGMGKMRTCFCGPYGNELYVVLENERKCFYLFELSVSVMY